MCLLFTGWKEKRWLSFSFQIIMFQEPGWLCTICQSQQQKRNSRSFVGMQFFPELANKILWSNRFVILENRFENYFLNTNSHCKYVIYFCICIQIKILKDSKKDKAAAKNHSRGVAFIEFSEHEHALVALRVLNNNPGNMITQYIHSMLSCVLCQSSSVASLQTGSYVCFPFVTWSRRISCSCT